MAFRAGPELARRSSSRAGEPAFYHGANSFLNVFLVKLYAFLFFFFVMGKGDSDSMPAKCLLLVRANKFISFHFIYFLVACRNLEEFSFGKSQLKHSKGPTKY